jgi:hypothetical protein
MALQAGRPAVPHLQPCVIGLKASIQDQDWHNPFRRGSI